MAERPIHEDQEDDIQSSSEAVKYADSDEAGAADHDGVTDIDSDDESLPDLDLDTNVAVESDDDKSEDDGSDQNDDSEDDDSDSDQAMGFDDIEIAYREALKSIDEAEQQVGNAFMDLAEADSEEPEGEPAAFTSIGEELAEDLEATENQSAELEAEFAEDPERITPRCVIEGALFVGGSVALTARKLASLIGQETDARVAVRLIDQLNEDYAAENRPYEIRLHEGGFQLSLREEFSEMQVKVFGLGPREVKLTPEVLELLSFVAYNQPVNQVELSNIKQDKVNTILRQLIRLKLVEVERTGSKRSDVQYITGSRFLRLFELESLDDLPQADVFSFK